jgi:hypothetical protein
MRAMSGNSDWQFGHYDVLFDPMALDRLRRQVHRSYGFLVVGVAVGIGMLLVVPLAAFGEVGLRGMAGAFWLLGPFVVLGGAFLVTASVNYLRSGAWDRHRPVPGMIALRLAPQGVVVGGTTYSWNDVERVYLHYPRYGEQQLVIATRPGVRPTQPVFVGFEGLVSPMGGISSMLVGRRGPHFALSTLAAPLSHLDAAFRHYSGGRFGIQP